MAVDIAELVVLADRLVAQAGERLSVAAEAGEVVGVMRWLAGAVEQEVNAVSPFEEEHQLACGPGCSYCCVVNVSVLVPEAATIAAYLQSTIPAGELGSLKEKIQRQAERVRWVEDQERPLMGVPCALLDDRGWCRIHPVRPLMCRSVSSADSGACRTISSREETVVVMNLPQKILCSMVFTGLAGILQQYGLDCRSLELNRMVDNILDRPSLVEDFLARKRVGFS